MKLKFSLILCLSFEVKLLRQVGIHHDTGLKIRHGDVLAVIGICRDVLTSVVLMPY